MSVKVKVAANIKAIVKEADKFRLVYDCPNRFVLKGRTGDEYCGTARWMTIMVATVAVEPTATSSIEEDLRRFDHKLNAVESLFERRTGLSRCDWSLE